MGDSLSFTTWIWIFVPFVAIIVLSVLTLIFEKE